MTGGRARAGSRPVGDGDPPPFPIRIARPHPAPACIDQLAYQILVHRSVDVEHQQVLVGRSRHQLALGVTDQLQVPARVGPTDHQQVRLVSLVGVRGVGRRAPEHLEAESVDPEPLCCVEVTAGAGQTQRTGRTRSHASESKGHPALRLRARNSDICPRLNPASRWDGSRVEKLKQLAARPYGRTVAAEYLRDIDVRKPLARMGFAPPHLVVRPIRVNRAAANRARPSPTGAGTSTGLPPLRGARHFFHPRPRPAVAGRQRPDAARPSHRT